MSCRPQASLLDRPSSGTMHPAGAEPRHAAAFDASLNAADRARCAHDVRGFSVALVRFAGQLDVADRERFLRRSATTFQHEFVPRFEENVRTGRSWAYATICNQLSQESGGKAGLAACRSLGARLSRLDPALVKKIEFRALALFVAAFGRHPRAVECHEGAIRIAEFLAQEGEPIQQLTSRDLSLLVDGFSKWPDELTIRQAAVRIAEELLRTRRANRLSSFAYQHLVSLVDGLRKWRQEPACRRAIAAIACELSRRRHRLSAFTRQRWANLVNGSGKWPENGDRRQRAAMVPTELPRSADELTPLRARALWS